MNMILAVVNAEELNFGAAAVIGIAGGVIGAVGYYFTMKGKIDLLKQAHGSLEADNKLAHERIGNLSKKVEAVEKQGPEIKLLIKEMEINILKEIRLIEKK